MSLEKLENEKKSNHGGARENSGRKPLLNKEDLAHVKDLLSQHGSEIDPLKQKERLLVLMDKLYDAGVKDGNIPAIKEYLDRMMGKSKESLDIKSDGERIIPQIIILPKKDE